MRHDKEKVFELRRQGKSYREIQKQIKISRNTLCRWFENHDWSHHIKRSNIEKHTKISREHLIKLNEGRREILDKQYAAVEEEARREFEIYKENSLFMAGLMLYAGEGEKQSRHHIKFANVDFKMHKVFINFLLSFMGLKQEKLRISLLLYPDLDIETCKHKWFRELDIPISQFHKPQVIQGKHKTRRLHFGVGSVIVSSSFLKRKLSVWIELAENYLINQTIDAAIV